MPAARPAIVPSEAEQLEQWREAGRQYARSVIEHVEACTPQCRYREVVGLPVEPAMATSIALPPIQAPPQQQPRRRIWRQRRKDQQRHLGRRDNAALRAALRQTGVRWDVCEACGADYLPCELDRRIPGDWEGEYVVGNVHYLCLVCHRAKTKIERAISGNYELPAHVDRWRELAFPEPVDVALVYYEQWYAARIAEGVS